MNLISNYLIHIKIMLAGEADTRSKDRARVRAATLVPP